MAIVNVTGISGINSITAQSNTLNFYDSAGRTLSIGASVSGNITGNVTGNLTGNVTGAINSTGVSTITTLSATSIVGVTTAGITTAYIGSVNDGPISGARNRIINGDMRIDQRNAGASVSITGGTSNYAADRFNLYVNTGTCALQRVSDAPTGFLYSDKVTVSSAGSSSSGASNAVHFEQKIEGYNIDDLGVGTSNAKTITLSFWVKSSITGTYSLHFGNDIDRYYVTTYTINSSNTWEYKTKTITLSTSGTWNTTNGRGLEIVWSLLGGSNYQTSSTDQWISADDYHATGSVQFAENASATWQVTGVQLESGTVATPFERRSYGQELALAQRYFHRMNTGRFVMGYKRHDSQCNWFYQSPVPMRVSPTPTLTTGGNFTNFQSSFGTTQSSPGVYDYSLNTGNGVFTVNSTWASTHTYIPSYEGFDISFSSEL